MIMETKSYAIHQDFKTIKKDSDATYMKMGDDIKRWYVDQFPEYVLRRYDDITLWNNSSLWLRNSDFYCKR